MTARLPHPAPSTSHPLPLPPLPQRLQREWVALCARPAPVVRARSWGLGVAIASLDDVVAATGHRATPSVEVAAADEANEVMRRLLLAARGDQLAARVVLQRLIPGLLAAARRWQRRHGHVTDAFDEVVAAAWTVIREFPVERRPLHLVANMLRDSEYRAFVRAGRRTAVHEPTSTERLDIPVEPHVDALGELAEVVACTASFGPRDRRLLGLLLSGRTTLEVAAELEVSERTVRAHRDSMVVRMRQAVAA